MADASTHGNPQNRTITSTVHPVGHAGSAGPEDKFERLILTNTWAWPLNHDPSSELFSRSMGNAAGRALIRRFDLLGKYFIPSAHRRRKLSEAEMAHYRKATPTPESRHPGAVLPGELIGAREFFTELEDQLSTLEKLTTLLLWADADPIFTDKYRKRCEATFPNHTTTVLHGVGHFLQSDAPAEFSEAIETWCAELAGDRGTASNFATQSRPQGVLRQPVDLR